MSNRTVMVAVDGSADSDRAFRFAAARTQPNDRLHVVNGAPDLVAFEYVATGIIEKDREEEAGSTSRNVLTKYQNMCRQENRNCTFESLNFFGGSSALGDAICNRAKDVGASEVVVGNRGLGAVSRMVLGSVSHYVANHCPCTVVVVKPDQQN